MRIATFPLAFLAISACSPNIPDSAAGVGFGDYNEYQAQQAAQARAANTVSPLPPASALSEESLTSATVGTPLSAIDEQQTIADATTATLAATRSSSGTQPLQANPSNPAPQTVESAAGISVENDFEAVDNVRSIESDAALIEQNRAQYQVVQPTALPDRVDDPRPNIVAYALSTTHPVGTRIYKRVGINQDARFARNCAEYGSPDRAQQDFLERGGPDRDRLGLDPDGDGFACNWNPAPFRNATNG